MAKKRKTQRSWGSSFTSEQRYIVYFTEVDDTTGKEIKKEEKGRYSDYLNAYNFLAGHYSNHTWEPVTTFDDKTATITQKVERKPNTTYRWFIEDVRE